MSVRLIDEDTDGHPAPLCQRRAAGGGHHGKPPSLGAAVAHPAMAMGLLSANAIKAALASREILIDPPPTEEQFDSDSVDVHLGNTIYRWRGSRAARG